MSNPGRSFICAALVGCVLMVPAVARAQRGAMTTPKSVEQMTIRAEVIVRGYVRAARVEPHPQFRNLTTVVVTLSVQETLKGRAGEQFEFRQYLWDIRDQSKAAGYRRGQELVLFLNPVSAHGLTSPVGLEQGRFRVVRDRQGGASAVNGRNNAGLFRQTKEQAEARGVRLSPRLLKSVRNVNEGPVALDDLKEIVRAFAGKVTP
jgi:hypothetical protein